VKELGMACTGGNKLIIKDGKEMSKPICGKKPPVIISKMNKLDLTLVLKNPGPQVKILDIF